MYCHDILMSNSIGIDILYKTQVLLLDVHLSCNFIGLMKVENMQSLDIFLGRNLLILVSSREEFIMVILILSDSFYHAAVLQTSSLDFNITYCTPTCEVHFCNALSR